MLNDLHTEEIVCYQIEIVVPEGTHSYIYSAKLPSGDEIRETYGMFAKIGHVSPLMHVVQHRQLIADAKEFWSQK